MVKWSIHQKDRAILNFNRSNKIASKNRKQKLSETTKRNTQFHSHSLRFNRPFSVNNFLKSEDIKYLRTTNNKTDLHCTQ